MLTTTCYAAFPGPIQPRLRSVAFGVPTPPRFRSPSQAVDERTYRLLTSGEPYDVRWVGCVGAASQKGQDSPKTLRAWLRDAVHVQVPLARCPEVRRAVHVDVEVEGAAFALNGP